MKVKLTLTVDRDLLPVAKRCARRRGRSLSDLVGEALQHLTQAPEGPSFSEKWRGKLRPAGLSTERYRHLAKKYL